MCILGHVLCGIVVGVRLSSSQLFAEVLKPSVASPNM